MDSSNNRLISPEYFVEPEDNLVSKQFLPEKIYFLDDSEFIGGVVKTLGEKCENLDVEFFKNTIEDIKNLERILNRLALDEAERRNSLVISDMNLTPGYEQDSDLFEFFSKYPINLYFDCLKKKIPFMFMTGSYSLYDQQVIRENQIGEDALILQKKSLPNLLRCLNSRI